MNSFLKNLGSSLVKVVAIESGVGPIIEPFLGSGKPATVATSAVNDLTSTGQVVLQIETAFAAVRVPRVPRSCRPRFPSFRTSLRPANWWSVRRLPMRHCSLRLAKNIRKPLWTCLTASTSQKPKLARTIAPTKRTNCTRRHANIKRLPCGSRKFLPLARERVTRLLTSDECEKYFGSADCPNGPI
jgi:hypothetical protein